MKIELRDVSLAYRPGEPLLMIPSINALMTVGLVSLPGMMTGQILAGADPTTAVRYQIIVMLMLVASTAIGSIVVVHIVRRLCFTRAHQMIL